MPRNKWFEGDSCMGRIRIDQSREQRDKTTIQKDDQHTQRAAPTLQQQLYLVILN